MEESYLYTHEKNCTGPFYHLFLLIKLHLIYATSFKLTKKNVRFLGGKIDYDVTKLHKKIQLQNIYAQIFAGILTIINYKIVFKY